jgi:hypothetical protein
MGSAMNAKMIVLLAVLHGCAIAFVVAMLVMLLRADQESCTEHLDRPGGGGGQPPTGDRVPGLAALGCHSPTRGRGACGCVSLSIRVSVGASAASP